MLHKQRIWLVKNHANISQLATELTKDHYPLHQAFRTPAGTVWANDSIGEESLQEYGVLRQDEQGNYRQVDSVTVTWCDFTKLEELLARADAGAFDDEDYRWGQVEADRLQFS